MIRAEKAERIMQMYENDYDSFLGFLKGKRKAKKAEAAKAKADADKADSTVAEAETHKKKHLGQKAKDLLDKAGGIEGAKDSIQNVMKYFKSDAPADYDINVGGQGDDAKTNKTIMGLPPMAVYAGGGVLFLVGMYALSRFMKNRKAQVQTQIPAAAIQAEPVLQAA